MLIVSLLLMSLAQSPAPPADGGLAPEWELKPRAEKVSSDVARLRPLLEQLHPERWTAAGAPAGYERQYRDCLDGIAYVQNAATRLSREPNRLAVAVETLVRLETLIDFSSSLSRAVRRYQNPAVADLLDSEIGAAGAGRDWLRRHVLELAAVRERELESAEKEAQACRVRTLKQGTRK